MTYYSECIRFFFYFLGPSFFCSHSCTVKCLPYIVSLPSHGQAPSLISPFEKVPFVKMTKKKAHSIRNSDWTIVERDTIKGKKRQSARRAERNQSYTEKEEIIDDLVEGRDPRTIYFNGPDALEPFF